MSERCDFNKTKIRIENEQLRCFFVFIGFVMPFERDQTKYKRNKNYKRSHDKNSFAYVFVRVFLILFDSFIDYRQWQ